jgi:hypothetical protein
MFTTYPHSQYYRDRTSERELCCDFPGDELFIRGLRAMELHLARYNGYVHIPVVRVMNTVHRAICILLHGNSGYKQADYDQAIHQALGQEQLLTSIAMVTLIAILRRTDGQRAKQCRSMLMDDRGEDFYEGLELYERLIGPTELRLNEEDFLTDVMRHITDLQDTVQQLTNERQQLIQERQQLKQQIQTMSKTPKHQTTVYNYGTYNDIHDNPHATIYATAPQNNQPDSILPPENDYTALVRWLEFEKLKGNDYYAEADCNRTKLCRNLLKIIGWEPDQNSLRKAQSR